MNDYDVPVEGLCDGCSKAGDCMPAGTLAAVERCTVAARVFAEMSAAGTSTGDAMRNARQRASVRSVLVEYLQSPAGSALVRRVIDEATL